MVVATLLAPAACRPAADQTGIGATGGATDGATGGATGGAIGGASGGATGGGGTTSGAPARVHVVAALYPLQMVAAQVGAGRAAAVSLARPGTEPHELELSPRQVAEISGADLVVYLRGFQPAVDAAVTQSGGANALDALAGVATANGDPHVWLDPRRLATLAAEVADRLTALDPDGGATYRRNAAALRDRLTRLDADFRAGLARCAVRTFVTTHAAFGYLADRYGLRQVSVNGLAPDTEPSPARVAQVEDVVRQNRLTTVFAERLENRALAETLAEDVGAQMAVLDPVEGLTSPGTDYFSLMRDNLQALRLANRCA